MPVIYGKSLLPTNLKMGPWPPTNHFTQTFNTNSTRSQHAWTMLSTHSGSAFQVADRPTTHSQRTFIVLSTHSGGALKAADRPKTRFQRTLNVFATHSVRSSNTVNTCFPSGYTWLQHGLNVEARNFQRVLNALCLINGTLNMLFRVETMFRNVLSTRNNTF